MECQKLKFKANCYKIGQSQLNVEAVPLACSIPEPLKILPARGTRPNKKINVNALL